MLFEATLYIRLWADAMTNTNWLRNSLPAQRVIFRIPYTLWTKNHSCHPFYVFFIRDMLFNAFQQLLREIKAYPALCFKILSAWKVSTRSTDYSYR